MHLFYDESIETNMWENLLYTTGHFTPDARTNIELLAPFPQPSLVKALSLLPSLLLAGATAGGGGGGASWRG